MKFGKLENADGIDFRLPEVPPNTTMLLDSLNPGEKSVRVYTGAPVWSMKEWVGTVFPPKTKPGDFLKAYGQQFNTVELNTSFYRIPPHDWVDKWRDAVPSNFRFSPKVHRMISQSGNLIGPEAMLDDFISSVYGFGEKLGMSFLQLPPAFAPGRLRYLEEFLHKWPEDMELAVEFRHPDWFQTDEGWDLLRSYGKTAVITDTAGRRDVCHLNLTTPNIMVRWSGNDGHPTDKPRLDVWTDLLSNWIERGLEQIYFFVHTPHEASSPDLINYFNSALNKKAQLQLPLYQNHGDLGQQSLF